MYNLKTGLSIELADITEETFIDCKESGVYSIDPGLSKRFTMDEFVSQLSVVNKKAEEYGVCIECIHLPYGFGWDISERFEPLRKAAVKAHAEVMRACNEVCPSNYFVLHPSAEPISDVFREERFKCAAESLSVIRNDKLLIENLPRSCLAHTADELLKLVAPFEEVAVCCDVNHLLLETPQSALAKLKGKAKHLHISDNDGTNERHWLPGEGIINWNEVIGTLEKIGYDKVFNYEVRKYLPHEVTENKKTLFDAYNGALIPERGAGSYVSDERF